MNIAHQNLPTPLPRSASSPVLPNWSFESFEPVEETFDNSGDLICLSHLRWDFVYQRPQHLMTRCAKERRVFYFEEPIFIAGVTPRLQSRLDESGVCVVTPQLPAGMDAESVNQALLSLIDNMCNVCAIHDPVLWYYTPMARHFTRHLHAHAIVYDCMDELSLFAGAHPSLRQAEIELFRAADLVFTGGVSLFEAKQPLHTNIHAMPSAIDIRHFTKARISENEPTDQRTIPRPRLGFAGVIDERFDIGLLERIATLRPEYQFIMIGPVVKIDPAILPRRSNIHYLGQRPYADLPCYFSGWDVALMPFARNEATRYISPTKTPEYLAAGRPVVSTSIRDVVRPYGDNELVYIADEPEDFVKALDKAMTLCSSSIACRNWLQRVDDFLKNKSWDETWMRMMKLLDQTITNRARLEPARAGAV